MRLRCRDYSVEEIDEGASIAAVVGVIVLVGVFVLIIMAASFDIDETESNPSGWVESGCAWTEPGC